MTVKELIAELGKFDEDLDVEVFTGVDNTRILSTPLENYCIIGELGQVVLMAEEFNSKASYRRILNEISYIVSDIDSAIARIADQSDRITELCDEF